MKKLVTVVCLLSMTVLATAAQSKEEQLTNAITVAIEQADVQARRQLAEQAPLVEQAPINKKGKVTPDVLLNELRDITPNCKSEIQQVIDMRQDMMTKLATQNSTEQDVFKGMENLGKALVQLEAKNQRAARMVLILVNHPYSYNGNKMSLKELYQEACYVENEYTRMDKDASMYWYKNL